MILSTKYRLLIPLLGCCLLIGCAEPQVDDLEMIPNVVPTAQPEKQAKKKRRGRQDVVNQGDEPFAATAEERIKVPKGFRVELLHSVPADEQGSWVSLATDPQGRLLTSDQYGKIYRVTPPEIGSSDAIEIEAIPLDIGMAHGLCYAFDSLYAMVNDGKTSSGLYRIQDTDGDDQYDKVERILELVGRGEHGPHAIIKSHDGKSLMICGGNMTQLPEVVKSHVPQNWDEDQLLPRMWDARGHAAGLMAPGGWIAKVTPEGKEFELIASGFRNEYDIALSPEGELFTYDADMEWDVGAPWYRPTRVCHVISGAEFGWRSGTGKWPTYYPESLPPIVEIGPGSPTGVVFGTNTNFPEKYQKSLFIADWSYGIIYAVHMTPKGSSYVGTLENFVNAVPLPVTDMVVREQDGSLYFTIGGRRTQSGLYRIVYEGNESDAAAAEDSLVEVEGATDPEVAKELRATRRELESLHLGDHPDAVEKAWPYLSHEDRFIRFAARIAIEHRPVSEWQEKAFAETDTNAKLLAMIALARNGEADLLPKIVKSLSEFQVDTLSLSQKLALCRAYGVTFARLGEPDDASREMVLSQLDSLYPSKNFKMNRELSILLGYLEAPTVAARTLQLLEKAPSQEEQIHYALVLRTVDGGWTVEQRERFFQWFIDAASHRGGMSLEGFLRNIRQEAIDNLTPEDKIALQEILEVEPKKVTQEITINRPFVKKWTVDEALELVEGGLHGRNYEQGRDLFAETTCFKCHRFAGIGGTIGPDLTVVGRRFSVKNLLESIIEPSKEVSDQYQATMFLLDDGRALNGRIINLSGSSYRVSTNMLDPSNLTSIDRNSVEEMMPSPLSMMPTGLVDSCNEEELLDLLAYLVSGGDENHPVFQASPE
ncbi:L-sorbosone dehydrogenase [Planctomycetales bacterium 10988]|nr:L-sorbosone dehydrogenase [Planctomycetales bacterium 10988]